ncbi:MAG: response regulator [Pleurocapsa sp.]
MSLNPDIRDQAYQFFIEEAQELLQVLETGLLDLRQDHSTPKVHELMRAAHSIKGGAASVELGAIELLAHRLEDFIKALYSDDVEFDGELESLLLQGYDCLSNPLTKQIELGTFDEEAALLAAEPVFAALEARLENALKNADNYIPSANDLGVDIVESIFEVDVVQALEHLQAVAANSTNYDPYAELQGQLEMFAGFAELFNLPGFSDIVQTAQAALAQNPRRVVEIILVTVADCTMAKDLVLAGDREQGGSVSPALRELAQTSNPEPSIALDKMALDEDTLWSDAPEAEFLADDIFGSILADEFTLAESVTETADLDSVFGTFTDAKATVQDVSHDDEQTAVVENNTETEETIGDRCQLFELIPADPQAEKITAAVESLAEQFDSLPSLVSEPTSLLLPTPKTATSSLKAEAAKLAKKSETKVTPKLSVRVDLDRLERMNNLLGELTINRNSLALQNNQLQENVSELGHKFWRFRKVAKKLREISDQMLLEQRSHDLHSSMNPAHHQPYSPQDITETITEFDSLEMDSYSLLYSSLQEVLEEIVQLEESVDDITIFAKQSDRTINSQRQMLGLMRDELMWVRMLPLEQILKHFPRTLRELANKYRKPVDLKLTGTGVLVDKAVLEKLADPLLHLLRNGFDHGIEDPESRTQQGKPATGSIEIQAYYQGNQTVIEVKDDGKGLDLAKITQKGIDQGLISTQEAASATKERLFELIFEPGFSTASLVSEISGRGVGMNIVRSQIETLKGKISVTSIPGQGSTFTMRLPLTLTIAKLLVCSLGSTAFAIASDSIEEIIIPQAEQLKVANEQKFLSLNNKLIPIYPLKEVLQYNCPMVDTDCSSKAFKTIAPPADWSAPLLLLRRGQQLFALEIVSLLSEQELVIKPYGAAIAAPAYSYGCTILSDGSLIPAFDGAALISSILGEDVQPIASGLNLASELDSTESAKIAEATHEILTTKKITSLKTIMVVDDSTALRRTMALTLEKAGYRVVQKKDGKDALNGFKQNRDLDLIICDVEMPVMNGFEFLGMRRRDSALSQVPTLMLTSRSGAKHRNLAMQLGADGYFTKPFVEQEFIREVHQILADQRKLTKYNRNGAIATNSRTVLIIDDSSALRRTLARSLEPKGYRVLQSRDGAEGLRQLYDNLQTDLVICDVEMPNVNGFEFLTTRRKNPELLKIPVVMLTSRHSDKHRALATSLGANGFFTKPYVEDEFLQDIEDFIDNWQ